MQTSSPIRLLFLGILLAGARPERALAISASYDPSTGNVHFMDVVKPPEGFGYHLVLESMAGSLLPGTTVPPYPVPGASADEAQLPDAIYWHWLDEPPVTSFSVENVVTSGTPVSDLSFGYGYSIIVADVIVRGLPLEVVPEPSALGLAMIGVLGLAWRRRLL